MTISTLRLALSALSVSVAAILSGCAGGGGAYPRLVPAETLLDDAPTSPDPAPRLQARAAALRAEAAAIRAETP